MCKGSAHVVDEPHQDYGEENAGKFDTSPSGRRPYNIIPYRTVRAAVVQNCHEQRWGQLRWPNAQALPEWEEGRRNCIQVIIIIIIMRNFLKWPK